MSGARACVRRRSLRGERIREGRGSLWRLESVTRSLLALLTLLALPDRASGGACGGRG
jgi:hypothetical protein